MAVMPMLLSLELSFEDQAINYPSEISVAVHTLAQMVRFRYYFEELLCT